MQSAKERGERENTDPRMTSTQVKPVTEPKSSTSSSGQDMPTTDPEPSTGSSSREHMPKSQKGEENTEGTPGTANVRESVVEAHFSSDAYKAVLLKKIYDSLSKTQVMKETPMGKAISKTNEELATKIGSLFIHVYGDGKKLTLPANSFPMRVVVSRKSQSFNFNDESKEAKLDQNLQYVSPVSHLEML